MGNKYKEMVIGIQGPRGGGKDAYGSFLACMYMFRGIPCYSNMPIKGKFLEGTVESKELDLDMLFKFGQGFEQDIVIYFSEIDKLIHRRRSISNANMILNVLATQIRKKGITIIANAQDWFWLDDEWVFQTDVLITCKDLAFTMLGHEENISEGYSTLLEFYNISGVMHAPPYSETGRPYSKGTFNTRAMWDKKINRQGPIFDSYRVMGVQEIMSKVVLHKEEIHLYADGAPQGKPDFSEEDPRNFLPESYAMNHVSTAIDHLKSQGINEIMADDFRTMLYDAGFQGDPAMIGRYMSRLNAVAKRQTVQGKVHTKYTLEPVGGGVV